MNNHAKGKERKVGLLERICLGIEHFGNKIPSPLMIFLGLAVIVFVVSLFFDGVEIAVPGTETVIVTQSLANRDFIIEFVSGIPKAFASYSAFYYVLIFLVGTSVCSETGFFEVSFKRMLRNVSDSTLALIVCAISINGNFAGWPEAFLPALCGILYYNKGRNPLLGIATSASCITAGFSACVLVTNADVQLAAMSAEAAAVLNLDVSTLSGMSTYYWQAASAIVLTPVAWFIAEKIVAPMVENREEYRLDPDMERVQSSESAIELTEIQEKGIRNAIIAVLVYIAFILIGAVPSNGFLRNLETGSLILGSPFMSCLSMLIVFLFFVPGFAYGVTTKAIKNGKDLTAIIAKGFAGMTPFFVTCLGASIFNTLFNKTNLASMIAIRGAELFQSVNLTGLPLVLCLILLVSFINLLMPNTLTKWMILAPVMVPMCALLHLSPEFTTALYKIGNSCTNCITPLSAGVIISVSEMQRYRKKSSFGSVIALSLPYCIGFLIVWAAMTTACYLMGIPVGPGVSNFI